MSKIVLDGREIDGTTGRYIRQLLTYLQKTDTRHEFHVLLHDESYDKITFEAKNFHKVRVTERKFTKDEQTKLPRTLKALNPDLVHFTMTNQPAFYKGKVVTTIHDLTPLAFDNTPGSPSSYRARQKVFGWLTKRVARKSVRVIVPSQYVKTAVAAYTGISPRKITITLESADELPGKPKAVKQLAGKRFIFFTGRAQPHKNLLRLVDAFSALARIHPDLYLVLAGSKSDSYNLVEQFASSSPARDRILFTGFVSDQELKWMYHNAEAYVLPSLSEGFGLPGLEAVVHGCILVSSNATCLPEIYGKAAYYFNPYDTESMAYRINEVLTNKQLRKDLLIDQRKQIKLYSWERMAAETLDVYERALKA